MAQYINKDALVAEIERRMKLRNDSYKKYHCMSDFIAFEELEYFHDEFIPTLEVKEVDLEKEMNEALTYLTDKDMRGWFRYFFELGLKARKL